MLADKRMSGPDRFFLASFGALAIWFAIDGLSTGEILMRSLTARRSKNQIFFWFAVATHFIIGIMMLLVSILGDEFWK